MNLIGSFIETVREHLGDEQDAVFAEKQLPEEVHCGIAKPHRQSPSPMIGNGCTEIGDHYQFEDLSIPLLKGAAAVLRDVFAERHAEPVNSHPLLKCSLSCSTPRSDRMPILPEKSSINRASLLTFAPEDK